MKKPETRLQQRIHKTLRKEFNWWGFKVHGGPFQQAGIPDIVGTCAGLFFAFEVKLPWEGEPSDIQLETLKDIRKAGGVAKIIDSVEKAIKAVYDALEKAGRLSEGCRRLGATKSGRRSVLRSRDRKDVDYTGHHRTPSDIRRLFRSPRRSSH